ncbi:MAG: hypothetical protein FWF51_09190 [Chitinivibrionia bacterium]|nr:hypothetical protein [Chitinivibrionia bacterium]
MKKLDVIKYVAVSAAFCTLFFVAGCGDNDDDGIDIAKEPPAASGGDLKRTDGKPVTTAEDLEEFIELFASAVKKSNNNPGEFVSSLEKSNNYSSVQRALREDKLPEEYEKETESGNVSYTRYGDYSGRVEVTGSVSWQKEWYRESGDGFGTGYDSKTYKIYDFSNHKELILGGSVGVLEKPYQHSNGFTTQINGTINFAGKYRGKVVLKDITVSTIYDHYGSNRQSHVKSGYFYVESDSVKNDVVRNDSAAIKLKADTVKVKFDLPGRLLFEFYPNSNYITDYPDEKITITMPDVPSVTGGDLSDRGGGEDISDKNVNSFFRAFITELQNNNAPRAANEEKGTWEQLVHGTISGYYTEKGDYFWQANNAGELESGTKKVEFHDYSNGNILYLGGGYAKAFFDKSSGGNRTSETIINGKIKFNGQFKGELDFKNFKYRNTYDTTTSVKIGDLDVTEKYWYYVVIGSSIAPDIDLLSENYIGNEKFEMDKWGNMASGNWYYLGSDGGEIKNTGIQKGRRIYWTADIPNNNDPRPNASMNIWVDDNQFLKEKFAIRLTYTCDRPIQLVLNDESPAFNANHGYAAQLEPGNFVGVSLTKKDFTQINLSEEDESKYDLDLSKVVGFSIGMNNDGENRDNYFDVQFNYFGINRNWD